MVFVFVYWGQGEDLWFDFVFQVEYQVYYVGLVLVYVYLFDVGIVGLDFGDQVFQGVIEVDVFDVYYQVFWVFDYEVGDFEVVVVFQCDVGVVFGWLDVYGQDL